MATETTLPLAEVGEERPLAHLVNYITDRHHVFARNALQRASVLADEVCALHGDSHPEVRELRDLLHELRDDLLPHMAMEETVLFPYIIAMEEAAAKRIRAAVPLFGTARNPVRALLHDHNCAGELLRLMREVSNDFATPQDVSPLCHEWYGVLAGLMDDLQFHLHLEANVLFPSVLGIEEKVL